MNRRWYGVPPLGGCASPDRLKPELHAVRGFMVPMRAEKSRKGAFHEPQGAAGILPAEEPENSSADETSAAPCWRPGPASSGSWSQCMRESEWGLSMNLEEVSLGYSARDSRKQMSPPNLPIRRGPNGGWESATLSFPGWH